MPKNQDNVIGKGFDVNPGNINRNGRPKKLPNLDKILADVLGEENTDGISEAQQLIKKLLEQGKKGNVRAAEIVLDRGYGKPKQIIESANTNLNTNLTEDQLDARIAELSKKVNE